MHHGCSYLINFIRRRSSSSQGVTTNFAFFSKTRKNLIRIAFPFNCFCAEIPYEIVLNPVSAKTLFDGSARIEMDVVVRSDTLRMIVVGRQGAAIGSVGKAARLELEEMWKKRVHLWLNVKVDG